METLYSLYYRSKFSQDDFDSLVIPMFQSRNLDLLKNLYQWLVVDPTDIDDAKYLLLKKFSEVLFLRAGAQATLIRFRLSITLEDC